MIRSLVVLDELPYPPLGGQQLRYRQAIDALEALGPVALLLLGDAPAPAPTPAAARPPRLVRLDPRVPRSWHYRWARLLGPRAKRAWRGRLRARHLAALRARVAAVLAAEAPDLVLVESAELMAYLPPLRAPGRRVVYDAHNVERQLWSELLPLRGRLGDAAPAASAFGERVVRGEGALLALADQVWACSEADAALFARCYPGPLPPIAVVPNAVDTEAFRPLAASRRVPPVPTEAAPTLLFTGNFGYLPNLEAARVLLGEIGPALRAAGVRPRLVLCGRGPPPELAAAAAADPSSVVVTGAVADARPWFAAADLFVVPLRVGGGTRLKILEALAAACPVVSTRKGAEGLDLAHGEHLLLADGPAGLADAALWCLRHRGEALAMARRGRAAVERRYSWEANRRRVRDALLRRPAAA